jgi:membrane protease subunit (stomatin/prohibitin family)
MSLLGNTTIVWEEAAKGNNLMWKVPRNIRLGDQIVVREDEYAVFYRDGKALGYFDKPDRYALTSINAPIVGPIVKFLTGTVQQAEVFYLQKRPFDAKFGSKQPYQFRDKDFGFVNLRLFGEARYRVKDPGTFIARFVGAMNLTTAAGVEDRLREQIIVVVYDALGELKEKGLGVVDLAANLLELEQVVLAKAGPHFEPYGIELQKISGMNISLPEEVQKAVDTRSSMQILGANYMQFQAGHAMREAASNPSGGAAATGAGLGAGIGVGYQMAAAMMGGMQQGMQQPPPQSAPPPGGGRFCPNCGQQVAAGAKFCGNCGAQMTQASTACPNCQNAVPPGTKFCPNCGHKVA